MPTVGRKGGVRRQRDHCRQMSTRALPKKKNSPRVAWNSNPRLLCQKLEEALAILPLSRPPTGRNSLLCKRVIDGIYCVALIRQIANHSQCVRADTRPEGAPLANSSKSTTSRPSATMNVNSDWHIRICHGMGRVIPQSELTHSRIDCVVWQSKNDLDVSCMQTGGREHDEQEAFH
jgi:hypothetical protein